MTEGPIQFVQPNLPEVRTDPGGDFWPQEFPQDMMGIVQSGMISNAEWCRKLERWATSNLGAKHAVAVSSCTSGLMLAARALGRHGMRSVLPSFTWISTGLAAFEAGMSPLFVDIDPRTLTMDTAPITHPKPNQLTIIPNVFGVDFDYGWLRDGEGPVIIDAAHAIASKYDGRPVGGFGDCAVFSLSPSKFATGGEGGIITTDDEGLANHLRALRDVGSIDRHCVAPGLNAKLSEFNACVGWHSLQGLGAEVVSREAVGGVYDSALAEAEGEGLISFQTRPDYGAGSGRQYYPIILPTAPIRGAVESACAGAGIPTRGYYRPALHQQDWFAGVDAPFGLRNTESMGQRILHLPIHAGISEGAANAIADVVLGALE